MLIRRIYLLAFLLLFQLPLLAFTPTENPIMLTPTNDLALSTSKPVFEWEIPASASIWTTHMLEIWDASFPVNYSNPDYSRFMTYSQISTAESGATRSVSYSSGATDALAVGSYVWRIGADYTPTDAIESYDYSPTGSFVISSAPFEVLSVLNYPNPFTNSTTIRYKLIRDADSVEVKVLSLNGKLVKILAGTTDGTTRGSEYAEVEWDGTNQLNESVNNGVYPYKITVTYDGGQRETVQSKMIKLR